MIRFACPGCSATFTVPDEKAGKTGKCPKCQSQFVIPDSPDVSAYAPPPLPPPPAPTPSRAPSPPPPPVGDPNDPVEIQPCPKCDTRLSVLPTDVGVDIQCPNCETVFKALRADAPPPPESGSKSKKGSSALVKLGSGSINDDDDEDDDRGSKKKSKRRGDDDDDDRPSKRRSSRRDDDEDDDDRPSRRRRRSRRGDDDDGYRQPDQATLVMVFTIIGSILCWNIFGIGLNIASLVIASMNLKAIDAGTMDATNRGQISTCRTINIIGLCIPVIGIICWCGFVMILGASGAAGR